MQNINSENPSAIFENELRLMVLENEMQAGDFHWYLEPVEVDSYIKEESRFDVTIEILKIKLPEVKPLPDGHGQSPGLSARIFREATEKDLPILLNEIMKTEQKILPPIEKVYKQYFSLISRFQNQIARYQEGEPGALFIATYITETLLKFEPSLVSLDYLGDFHTFNLIWLVSKLNSNKLLINLELDTVEYLIKRCDSLAPDYAADEKYQSLSALFLHKARYEY